jgi:acyl carrier protein
LGADTPLTPDLSLNDHGLDSVETVSLLLDLEDSFGVTIPDDLMTLTSFASPGNLWDMLAKAGVANPS